MVLQAYNPFTEATAGKENIFSVTAASAPLHQWSILNRMNNLNILFFFIFSPVYVKLYCWCTSVLVQ